CPRDSRRCRMLAAGASPRQSPSTLSLQLKSPAQSDPRPDWETKMPLCRAQNAHRRMMIFVNLIEPPPLLQIDVENLLNRRRVPLQNRTRHAKLAALHVGTAHSKL